MMTIMMIIVRMRMITITITIIMGIKQRTFHKVALLVHCYQVELEFAMLVFVEEGKPKDPARTPRSEDANQLQTKTIGETMIKCFPHSNTTVAITQCMGINNITN